MRIQISKLIYAVAALCLCSGCAHNHEEHHEDAKKHDHTHGPDEIIFTPEQAKAAGLQTEIAKMLPFERSIKVTGKIIPAAGDQRTVSAPVSGILSIAGQPLTDGMHISAGQSVFSISGKGLEQSDATVGLKIRYEAAKREYERAKPLLEDRIITQTEFTVIEEAYRQAAAELSTLTNRTANGSLSVTSPISGYLIQQLAQPGDFVQQGAPLFVVSQNKRLQLQTDVPQQYAGEISGIVSANFKLPGFGNKLYSTLALNGHKVSSGKSTEAAAGYIPLFFEFDNTPGLVSGSYAEVYLLSGNATDAITVPLSALTEEQGLYFVYIRIEDHAYRKQEVKPGASNGERVEILSGVNPGDEVVTAAVGHLKLAANSGQVPPGHTHNH